MATADKIYADPSALLKLYLHEPESRPMAAWRGKLKGPLAVTHHGRVELTNGIALAAHRGAGWHCARFEPAWGAAGCLVRSHGLPPRKGR